LIECITGEHVSGNIPKEKSIIKIEILIFYLDDDKHPTYKALIPFEIEKCILDYEM
jgi:hypothetical protein